MPSPYRSSVAVLLVLFLMACGGTAAAVQSPKPAAVFTMGQMNKSGVTGVGQVYKAAGSFTVAIQLHGLVPNSSHVSHVHVGSCAKQGNVAYALLQVVADGSGNATATTTVGEYYSMPATGWYVNVHQGENMDEAEYVPSIACGDLPPA
jgi:hypothetical protein